MFEPRVWARLARSRSALAGGAIVLALVLFALLGPIAAGHGPLDSDFVHGIGGDGMPVGPNARFLLGTDRLFRDVLVHLEPFPHEPSA